MMKRTVVLMCLSFMLFHTSVIAGDTTLYTANELFEKMREKLLLVEDYSADVRMNISISYMRVPPLAGKLYYKAPDKVKLDRRGGISIMPKKGMSFNLSSIVPASEATIIDAGTDEIDGHKVHIIKVIPDNDEGDVVLTKIWVDEERLVALRTETTTKGNGTVRMELEFEAYEKLALPDKVTFYIDEQEYKLPKGMTMDYDVSDMASKVKTTNTGKKKKGKVEIKYLRYEVNKGLKDSFFE